MSEPTFPMTFPLIARAMVHSYRELVPATRLTEQELGEIASDATQKFLEIVGAVEQLKAE